MRRQAGRSAALQGYGEHRSACSRRFWGRDRGEQQIYSQPLSAFVVACMHLVYAHRNRCAVVPAAFVASVGFSNRE